jgi:hypothetical protein
MCFSSTASFGAGVVLAATGVVTRTNIKSPDQVAFASIPFLFAAQQFAEGFLWLSLRNTGFSSYQIASTYIYLIFAQIVWPLWVPFSIMKMETNPDRKKGLRAFLTLGALVSCYLAYCLFTYPVQSDVVGYHIQYTLFFPQILIPLTGVLYFVSTVVSPFISSVSLMPVLGAAIFASYSVTLLYFNEHVISVWCFFAAILSVSVYLILLRQKQTIPLAKSLVIR